MPRTHRPQEPHTFPEQARQTSTKRYLVTGPQPVAGVRRGGYVELALTEAQERVLLESGAAEAAPRLEPATEKKSTHTKWADVKKNRPSKADTTEQE